MLYLRPGLTFWNNTAKNKVCKEMGWKPFRNQIACQESCMQDSKCIGIICLGDSTCTECRLCSMEETDKEDYVLYIQRPGKKLNK